MLRSPEKRLRTGLIGVVAHKETCGLVFQQIEMRCPIRGFGFGAVRRTDENFRRAEFIRHRREVTMNKLEPTLGSRREFGGAAFVRADAHWKAVAVVGSKMRKASPTFFKLLTHLMRWALALALAGRQEHAGEDGDDGDND